jgi:hypothetical protein
MAMLSPEESKYLQGLSVKDVAKFGGTTTTAVCRWYTHGLSDRLINEERIEAIALRISQNLNCTNARALRLFFTWLDKRNRQYQVKIKTANYGQFSLDLLRAIALKCSEKKPEFTTFDIIEACQELGITKNPKTVRNWSRKMVGFGFIERTETVSNCKLYRFKA